MDRLTLMRSFVGVTKSRSFSQAARALGISGSLVSRSAGSSPTSPPPA
jgi:DNA-binding transcriptional LysR family regulator